MNKARMRAVAVAVAIIVVSVFVVIGVDLIHLSEIDQIVAVL